MEAANSPQVFLIFPATRFMDDNYRHLILFLKNAPGE
jgi:hypothetical protein